MVTVLLTLLVVVVIALLVARFAGGVIAPLSYSIPQNIKDRARSNGLSVETIPWAFFEEYGSIIVGQAKLLSPRKFEQANFAVACVRELVMDMRQGTVKPPPEWQHHLELR